MRLWVITYADNGKAVASAMGVAPQGRARFENFRTEIFGGRSS